jgi:hypothetical protein
MPVELFDQLEQLIVWQRIQRPWTRQRIKEMRWATVREGRDRELSLEEACEYAARTLDGVPARAEPEMMRKEYYAVERTLPLEQRQAKERQAKPAG